MKNSILVIFFLVAIVLGFGFANNHKKEFIQSDISENIAGQSNPDAFDKMMKVLTHQRCVNCHPAGNKPIKGDDKHVTRSLGIPRGHDGHGTKAINCGACHSDENNDFSGVPGAAEWALAPEHMTWEGKTRVEIATQMMDPARNGGRTPKEIMEHLTEHELVLWAWNPGVDSEGVPREIPPVSKEDYIDAVKEWIAGGAIIPEK